MYIQFFLKFLESGVTVAILLLFRRPNDHKYRESNAYRAHQIGKSEAAQNKLDLMRSADIERCPIVWSQRPNYGSQSQLQYASRVRRVASGVQIYGDAVFVIYCRRPLTDPCGMRTGGETQSGFERGPQGYSVFIWR